MQGALTTGEEDILFIEIEPTNTVSVLKTRIEFQTSHPPTAQSIFYNGKQLEDEAKTMEQYDVTPDSMLGLVVRKPKAASSAGPSRQQPAQRQQAQPPRTGVPDAETIRLQSVGNPEALAQLRAFSPELAEAIHDPARFKTTFDEVMNAKKDFDKRQREREAEYIRLQNADEFDMEAQARIAEILQEDAVEKERLHAAEYYPECKYPFFDVPWIEGLADRQPSCLRPGPHALYTSRSQWPHAQSICRFRGPANYHVSRLRREVRRNATSGQAI